MKLKTSFAILALAIAAFSYAGSNNTKSAIPADYKLPVKTEKPYLAESASTRVQSSPAAPAILTFAPGSSWAVSGLLTLKGKAAIDISTPISKLPLGSNLWSLQSDALAGAIVNGNGNVGFDLTVRYDSRIPIIHWTLFASLGGGQIFPLGAGNGPQFVLTGAFGLSIPTN